MKKLTLAVTILFFMVAVAWGSSVTVTGDYISRDGLLRTVTISCVGDISDTDLDTTNLSESLVGWYPWTMIVKNTSGTTVTDNSDVYLRDSGDNDLLDGVGVDQLDNDTRNDIDIHSCNPIIATPYLDVDNQIEATGAYTVTITFVK